MEGINCASVVIFFVGIYCVSAQDAPAPDASGSASKLYPLDQAKFDSHKEKICPLIPKLGGDDEKVPEWKDQLSEDEVFELALLNLAYGLTTDAILPLPKPIGWKKKIIDLIAYVAKTTCGENAVSAKFVNAIKNIFMYYILKMEKTFPSADAGSGNNSVPASWTEVHEMLTSCAAEVGSIGLVDDCGRVTGYVDGTGAQMPALAIKEELDKDRQIVAFDIIVDSIWWMFSTTYARCYAHHYPEVDVVLQFYQQFRDDILSPFNNRWVNGGSVADAGFDIIFGPLTVDEEYSNLRMCTTAAYNYERLSGRQLVRPLIVLKDGVPVRNFKA